jgi:hypothetical protein
MLLWWESEIVQCWLRISGSCGCFVVRIMDNGDLLLCLVVPVLPILQEIDSDSLSSPKRL